MESMGTPSWFFRALPALGTIGLIGLWLLAASSSVHYMVESFFGLALGGSNAASNHSPLCAVFELLLALYIVFLHLLAVAFPLRPCWSVVIMTWEIACARIACERRRRNMMFAETTPAELDSVIHAVLMPNYKEDMSTLRDTLDVLAGADLAKTHFDIWLAKEEKDPNAKPSAASLEEMYQGAFRSIQSTFHPTGIPGETQGKSSNVSWAAKRAMSRYEREDMNKEVMFTVIDSDTNLSPDYFMLVSEMHSSSSKARRDISLYVPPVIFDRNAHKVPLFVRLADLVWSGASLSGTYPGSSVCIPTSVYSVPMALASSVGGWDTGSDAIGEDMHMYLKCFFHTRGDLITRPVPSAASHCNVSSPKQGLGGYFDGLVSRWQQGLRHMWGSLDSGYAYRRLPLLLKQMEHTAGESQAVRFKKMRRVVYLFLRLFEAHCLPVQLPFSMIASALFEAFIPKVITPAPMRVAFCICAIIRPICFLLMILYFSLYRRYHSLCLKIRMEDYSATHLGGRDDFSNGASPWWFWAECCAFPIAGTLFGTVPAFYAQISHLFTDKLVYTVSLKPLRQLAR